MYQAIKIFSCHFNLIYNAEIKNSFSIHHMEIALTKRCEASHDVLQNMWTIRLLSEQFFLLLWCSQGGIFYCLDDICKPKFVGFLEPFGVKDSK